MNDEVKVHVVDKGRTFLYMRYVDPQTGRQVTRSTGTNDEKAAIRVAAKWEAELQEGRYKSPNKITWGEFRERYEREKLSGLSDGYAASMASAMNRLEGMGIQRLSQVTSDLLSRFAASCRDDKVSESTIRTYLKHLKAAFNWAAELRMMSEVPKFTMPKRARMSSKMKGRPITAEEFERMISAVPDVRPDDAPLWQRYLWGLWLSGLRLAESLRLTWDDDGDFCVDLTGRHPRFLILAEGQKRHRDEYLPMTPDFAEWLLETPEGERVGPVFKMPVNADAVGRIVGDIGVKANVVIDKRAKSRRRKPAATGKKDKRRKAARDKPAGKFATAHDLRRSFGTRWSKRVKPATLQKLMRHADIKTTMEYYVDQDADDIAAELWAGRDAENAKSADGVSRKQGDTPPVPR